MLLIAAIQDPGSPPGQGIFFMEGELQKDQEMVFRPAHRLKEHLFFGSRRNFGQQGSEVHYSSGDWFFMDITA